MVPKLSFDTGYPLQHEPRSPFEVTAARSLRIVVDDAEVLRPSPAMRLLAGFEHHQGVAIYRTGDRALRHLQIRESRKDDAAYATVVEKNGHEELFIGGLSNKEGLAANLSRSPAVQRAVRRRLILGHVADALGADATVTCSSALRREPTRGNPMTPAAACSLLGLYLRGRGDHTWLRREGGGWSIDARSYHDVLLSGLLPEAVRLLGALPRSTAPWDTGTLGLGKTLMVRAERAIRARDSLHRCFLREQRGDVSDEALVAFDSFLVNVSAAFDALAQLVHAAYALAVPRHQVGWRRQRWFEAAAAAAPNVARVVQVGTPARDVLDLLSTLRNTIHGHALETIAFVEATRNVGTQYPLVVPARFDAEFVGHARRCGGLARLGIRRLPGNGPYLVELDRFVEHTLPLAFRALDAVAAAIDVAVIPGSRPRRPAQNSHDLMGQRRAITLLAGLTQQR